MRIRGGGSVVVLLRGAPWHRLAGALILALAAAGCSGTIGQTPASLADARGATIAFESIEGPPAAVFHRFVRDLNDEAAARQVVVVPRGGAALYRIRGYLATHAEQGATAIAWAWDVYDANQQRAFRISGEERSAAARNSWAAADEQVLRRIARASMDQLVGFLASPGSPAGPATPAPARRSSILAALDDFRPEAAGIFRILGSVTASPGIDAATAPSASDVPLPRDRPLPAGTESAALAFSDAPQ